MTHEAQRPSRRDPFSAEISLEDLEGRSIRGGAHAVAARGIGHAVELLALAVLARVLSPEDFGLLAMVAAVVGLLAVFKDAGLPAATVQRESVSDDQVSALFWLNAGLSGALVLTAAALGPAIAWFYGESRLAPIAAALGVGFLFVGLEAQHVALLQRQMRFRTVAWMRTGALSLGAAAGVTAALAGLGYWALVVRGVVTPFASMVFAWALLPWRPLPPWRARGAGPLLRFGSYLTAFGAVNHLGRNLDNVLIGRFFGGASLGLYAKAYGLLMMPIQMINGPVNAVVIPALSRLSSDPERRRSFYYKALTLVATLSMPIVAWLAAVTDSFVLTVLGEQWLPAADLFRILAIPAFIGTFNVATGWVFVSLGRVREQLISGSVNTAVGALAIGIGVQWGVEGVAWALVASSLLRRLPTLAYCYRGTSFTLTDLARALWRPAAASLTAGLATHLLHAVIAPLLPPPSALALSLPVFAVAYVSGLAAFPGGRALVAEVASGIRLLNAPRRSEATA